MNIALLMLILGVITWSLDAKIFVLTNSLNKEFLKDACRSIRLASLMVWVEANATTTASFSSDFNISFNNTRSFDLKKEGDEYLCLLFINNFVDKNGNAPFSLEVKSNITFFNNGSEVFMW